jgi:hypothetical protein
MGNKNDNSRMLIALEEWKLASSVIARLENVEHQMRNWLFGLLTALTVALYSNKVEALTGARFIAIGILLVATFVWMDLIHRMPKRGAIELSKEIETCLRDNLEYGGPSLSTTLAKKRTGKWNELKRMLKNTPYIQIMLLVVLLGLVPWFIK